MEEIRDYYGEKIALYFLFLSHYTTWLLAPGIVGFPFFHFIFLQTNIGCDLGIGIYIHISLDTKLGNNVMSVPFFAAFMALWATFFLEFWKRKEKTFAMKWGMTGF